MLELECQHFVLKDGPLYFHYLLMVLMMFALGINKRSHESESMVRSQIS